MSRKPNQPGAEDPRDRKAREFRVPEVQARGESQIEAFEQEGAGIAAKE